MIISRAPLRISFLGGGTDYPEFFRQNGGSVLASTVDKYSYVTASTFHSQLFDYSIRLSYRENEIVRDVADIKHRVFRECLREVGLTRDIELHTVADLPAFTGLGSSSSFTVALLHVLHAFKGEFRTPRQLAIEAIHLERERLNEPVGCQDQVLSAFGGFNLIEFRRDEQIEVTKVPISTKRLEEFERHIFIIFTGIKRRAADVAQSQIQRVPHNMETLTAMHQMVERGWDILTGPVHLDAFGELLHEAWMAKRSLDPNVSNPLIDELYERGRGAGAMGGKLLGAGGGGFLLLFAPPAVHSTLATEFADLHRLDVQLCSPGSQIIFS